MDTGKSQEKGATKSATTVLEDFKSAMSEEEPFIARALGGRESEAYLQIFPNKLSEYSDADKEDMNTLTDRVFTAANTYASALGTTLTNKLTGFKDSWESAHNKQEARSSKVEADRGDRSERRIELETTLMKALGFITYTYPGNEAKCKQYFDFSLLYPVHHQKVFHLTLAANTHGTILHHHFAADAQIKVTTSTAANIELYLTDTENVAQNTAQPVAGNTEVELKIADFHAPLEAARYLFIKNASLTTAAEIRVELL